MLSIVQNSPPFFKEGGSKFELPPPDERGGESEKLKKDRAWNTYGSGAGVFEGGAGTFRI